MNAPVGSDEPPAGLTRDDWGQIRRSIQQSEYHTSPVGRPPSRPRTGSTYTPPPCTAPGLFRDVPVTSPFCPWIEELVRRGVIAGCAPLKYCPNSDVPREDVAVFVLRTLDPSLNPPPCVPPNVYNDVPETNPNCRWIEELAARGVAVGCGGGNYCPTETVTREQMAVFITAAFGLSLYRP